MKRTAEINHLIGIKGSLDEVYAAVSEVGGLKECWTVDTKGVSQVGGIIRLRFGGYGVQEMKVTALKKNSIVKWTCIKHSAREWIGTEFTFSLKLSKGQVYLRFRQAKWKEAGDFLAYCTTKWAAYLLGLKEFIETGNGRPYPHDLQTTHN
jgi:hypothetical protein